MTSDLKYLTGHMCVDGFCSLWTDAPFSCHCTKPGYRVSEIIFDPQTWEWDHSSCLALGKKAAEHISPTFQTVYLILSNNKLCEQLLQVFIFVLCHGMWNCNSGLEISQIWNVMWTNLFERSHLFAVSPMQLQKKIQGRKKFVKSPLLSLLMVLEI